MPLQIKLQLLIPIATPVAKAIGKGAAKAISRIGERRPRRFDRLLRRYAAAVKVDGVPDPLGAEAFAALAERHLRGETSDEDRTRLVAALRLVEGKA